MAVVHPVAQSGFAVGTNDLYDQVRPSYQAPCLDFIRESVKSSGPLNIVEIGSGTGIFTRALLSDSKWNVLIKELKAFEPSEGMRNVFSRTVKDDRVSVCEGYFHSISVDDGWADLVVIAQAYHWCLDYDAASAEFARVMKPGGIVALIWNLEDKNGASWVAQVTDIMKWHKPENLDYHSHWRETFNTPAYQRSFVPPLTRTWLYNLGGTKESVVVRASSWSHIAILPDDKKRQILDEIRRIMDDDTSKVWVDSAKGVFEYPYKTNVIIWEKREA